MSGGRPEEMIENTGRIEFWRTTAPEATEAAQGTLRGAVRQNDLYSVRSLSTMTNWNRSQAKKSYTIPMPARAVLNV
jgi:hypothetical protein